MTSLSVPDLPPEEVDLLRSLRDAGPPTRPELRRRVRALRDASWSYAALARALDTHRSVIRSYDHHPSASSPLPPPRPVPRPPLAVAAAAPTPLLPVPLATRVPVAVATLPGHLTPDRVDRLRELSARARRVRGHTVSSSPNRTAAYQLDALLRDARSRGVPVAELARACSLTPRAVRDRLAHSPSPVTRAPLRSSAPSSAAAAAAAAAAHLLVVWPPAPTPAAASLRWRTYVNARTARPLAFAPALLSLSPSPSPAASPAAPTFYLLTPADADEQLGWPAPDTELVS